MKNRSGVKKGMKKLIDVTAVNIMKAEGKTVVYVDDNTLITPAARDEISKNDMIIQEREERLESEKSFPETRSFDSDGPEAKQERVTGALEDEVSVAQIFKVLTYLHKTGLLQRPELLEKMFDSYIEELRGPGTNQN